MLYSIHSWYNGYSGKPLLYTDSVTLAYVCGNAIRFLNTKTEEETYLISPGDGIRSFASNPPYNTIAFSDVCIDAKIYIYELPFLEKPKVALEGKKCTTPLKHSSFEISHAAL